MHVHAAWPGTLPTFGPLFLANGVTGVREMWGSLDLVAGSGIRFAQHAQTEPRFVASGAMLDGSPSIFPGAGIELHRPDEVERIIDSLRVAGADFIKIHGLLSGDVFSAVMASAEDSRLDVVGHVPHAVGALEASRAGLKSNEHLMDILLSCSSKEDSLRADLVAAVIDHPADSTFPVEWRQSRALLDTYNEAKCEALAAELARDSMWQVPTLTVNRSVWFLTDTADVRLQYIIPAVTTIWSPGTNPMFSRWAQDRELADSMFSRYLQLVGLFNRAGVPIMAGTDVLNPFCFPGFSLHDELALLVEAGLTPMQALQAATRNPAVFLNASDSLGTVEPGKLADLVILDADPIADIHNTALINAVVLDGKLIDNAALQRTLNSIRLQAGNTAAPTQR
jgi:hypothetical protein